MDQGFIPHEGFSLYMTTAVIPAWDIWMLDLRMKNQSIPMKKVVLGTGLRSLIEPFLTSGCA